MKKRKIIRICGGVVATIALIVAFLLLCPGPIDGTWTGPMVACMCDAHNCIVINDGTCVLYFEDETNSPPQRTFCEKTALNTWTWHYTETLPKGNSAVGIRTNVFVVTPHILHAKVLDLSDGHTSRLFRDFRRSDATRIRDAQSNPEEIEYFRSKTEKALLARERTAANKPNGE